MIEAFLDFLNYDFLWRALWGTIFVSLSCGVLSPLIVARKYAFIGSAMSHSTLLGLSIAASFFANAGAMVFFLITLSVTLLITSFLAKSTYKEKLPSDSLIGIFFTVTMGLGMIIHSKFSPNQSDLLNYLFGQILLIEVADLWIAFSLCLLCLIGLALSFKKWCYFLYDPAGAELAGVPVKALHYGQFLLMTLVIVSSLKIAGTVLVNTLLIIPGVFALSFARSMKQTFIYSMVFSVIVSAFALVITNAFNWPSGAGLAVVQFVVLILALGLKRFLAH
jgi:ABC-type Mn2+/Zn2+ transport system permease subunit